MLANVKKKLYLCVVIIEKQVHMVIPKEILEIIKAKCFTQEVRELVTDKDYEKFSQIVATETGTKPMGVNTWKRIFGHLTKQDNSPYVTSKKTSNIIASYLGCDSWEQLCENQEYLRDKLINNGGVSNASVVVNKINDSLSRLLGSLQIGNIIEVKSYPNKVLCLRLLRRTNNSCWYKIVKTVGSKQLQVGDELEIVLIRENHPLQVVSLRRNGTNLGEYVSGSKQVVYSVKRKNV